MSDIIHLLPDNVANQIAAGEVIQRPASVVKELIENSIDAHSSNIQVLLTDSGKTRIQIIDNGIGMSETDARLAFERHATSKIQSASDLFALNTMGFRGEALASIAAVAQVELRTKTESQEVGTLVTIAGSKLLGQEVISCAKGCSFTVDNLFFNVPARRKFLKSNQTELSNILSEFERISLVHPDVSFELYHNGVEMYNLPETTLKKRLIDVFGKKMNEQLLDLGVETTLVKISGFVGKPDSARKKGANQFFFVNHRYMRHPYFHKAVMEAFNNLVQVGEQVPYFIYFEVDPANIDVNIHPTKTEIKFENEQAIWQILEATVKESLGKFNAVPSIDFDTEGMPDIPVMKQTESYVTPPQPDYNPNYNPFNEIDSRQWNYQPKTNLDWQSLYKGLDHSQDEKSVLTEPERTTESIEKISLQSEYYQYKGQFIVTSVKSGLIIIDQHNAHIQVLFEQYISQLVQGKGISQGVLFPEVIQLPYSEVAILEEYMNDFNALGFDLTNLGGGSYAINGIPSGSEGLNFVDLIHSMLQDAMMSGTDVKEHVRKNMALAMAKTSAIVRGQVLSQLEMENLVASLFACKSPTYTADGKKIFTIIADHDIEKMFN